MLKMFVLAVVFYSFSFGLSLNRCVKYAISNSVAVKKSKNEIKISNINREISRVSQFGEINLLADLNHYNGARTLAPLTPSVMKNGKPIPESKNIFSIGVSYTLPIFTGFSQMHQIELDRIASKIAQIKSRLTKEEVVYNVKSIYLTALAQKELLIAQKSYLKVLQRLKRTIEIAVNEGKKAQIDYFKAEAQIENTKSTIESLKSNINILKATLSSIIGRNVKRVQRIKIKPHRPRYSIKRLLRKVPTLKKISIDDMAVAKAGRAIKKVEASKLPQVTLNVYAGKNFANDEVYDLGLKSANIYQVGLKSKWNMVDFGKRNLQIERAKILQMQSKLNRVKAIRELKKSIREAIAKIRESFALYRSSKSEFRLSRKTQRIEKERYESGVSTINDFLLSIAQKELARAKTIQSKYNYQKSIYYLDYILERGVK